jgi:cytochrome c oxidase cbb3-type subunit III
MSTDKDKDKVNEDGYGTTGHSWDGIEEWNNPLPRWWVWTFYVTIIWGIIYTILYPAWPLVTRATPGILGFSTRAQVQEDIDRVMAANAALNTQLEEIELVALNDNPDLAGFAVNQGAAVFRAHCSQCHGSGAAGVQAAGYPSLLDDDWLWGGSLEEIAYTIRHGIRNEQDLDAHWSQMPAYGDLLSTEEIDQVVHHVLAISGQEHDAVLAAAGEQVFLDQCSACHMEDGTGDRFQGAPNLTDAIWLYGGDAETLRETVTNSRFGVMPAWGTRLTEAEVRAAAAYVHQLGGGE